MTTQDADDRVVVLMHRLLLRVAGWAPDEVVRDARDRLARGLVPESARLVLEAVLGAGVPIAADDAELLARVLPGTVMPAGAAPAIGHECPPFEFRPARPEPFPAGPTPLLLDLTGPETPGDDAAAVAALDQVAGPVALWRAWRSPRPGDPDGLPVRVYLLETAGDAATLPDATARLQDALGDAPVEAYGPGVELPPYQRMARGRAALLWASAEAGPVTVARVFDSWAPVIGGQFRADHPLLAGDEAADVLGYLEQGHLLLATTLREQDVYDTEAGAVVPAGFRTDGRFIWTDAVAYYLRTYALSPDPELLAHIRDRGCAMPPVDAVAEHRAMAALTNPAA